MLIVELASDDLDKNGSFVRIGRIAHAIAQANGAENVLDAERKLFPRINAGVQLGQITPLHPENLTPLPKNDYGNGIVPFDELAAWGRSTKLFDFRRVSDTAFKSARDAESPASETAERHANHDIETDGKPWELKDPRDPEPVQSWYTPARYFARQLVKEDSTLLTKREMLATKTAQALKNSGYLKRGGKHKLDPGTVKKAFSNVILS